MSVVERTLTVHREEQIDQKEQARALGDWFAEQSELASMFQINDQDDLELAAAALQEIKSRAKNLEKIKKEATDPMMRSLEVVRSWFQPALGHAALAERVWKTKIANSERSRNEANAKAVQQIAVAHRAGDQGAVAVAHSRISPVEQVKGLSFRDKWVWDVADLSLVPTAFLCVDDRAVRKYLDEHPTVTEIPGLVLRKERIVASRG